MLTELILIYRINPYLKYKEPFSPGSQEIQLKSHTEQRQNYYLPEQSLSNDFFFFKQNYSQDKDRLRLEQRSELNC
jgi:hypothetical protein